MFSGKGHSKLSQTPMMKDFLENLQAIAPEYLTWHEADGSLICIQNPVDPKSDPLHVNTVPDVLHLLHLSRIKPDKIIKDARGVITYIFTLQDFADRLNAKKWSKVHFKDFAGINSTIKQAHKPK